MKFSHSPRGNWETWRLVNWFHEKDKRRSDKWNDSGSGAGGGTPKPVLKRPGTRVNKDGSPKDPTDQVDQIGGAQAGGKLIEVLRGIVWVKTEHFSLKRPSFPGKYGFFSLEDSVTLERCKKTEG